MEPTTSTPSPSTRTDFIKPLGNADLFWSFTHGVLDALKQAADYTPVPALKPAAKIALAVVSLIEGARHNKRLCKSLVEDACYVVFGVYSECRSIQGESEPYREIPPQILKHVESLALTLQGIKDACVHITSRPFITRALGHQAHKKTIENLRENLKLALQIFDTTSLITISELVQRYSKQAQVAPTLVSNLQIERATLNSFSHCGNTNIHFHPTEVYEVAGSPTRAVLEEISGRAADAVVSTVGQLGAAPMAHRIMWES